MEVNIEAKLNTISELTRLKLANLLQSIGGRKDLIIEPGIIRTLDKICGAKWLRLYDVEKIYKLEDNFLIKSTDTQVFLISSNLIQFKRVVNIIEANNKVDVDSASVDVPGHVRFHVIVIPKNLGTFEMLLEESGLYGKVEIHPFLWQFIYLDTGLISLELPNLFTEIFVNKDLSLLTSVGKSLYFLFDVIGKPSVRIALGKHSQKIFEHIELFEENLGSSDKVDSDFGAIMIMDRNVDYISTLLTNVTYTGLLGEIYKISGGVIENRFPEKAKDGDSATSSPSEMPDSLFSLDSFNDSVYLEIKNRHISEVSEILGSHAKQLKMEKQASQDMALSEIKNYVQTKLQNVTTKSRQLSNHLHTCEKIISELGVTFEKLQFTERSFMDNASKSTNVSNIEDFIITNNKLMSLRLICLISMTQKLTWDEYNNLKLQYLHQNGYPLLYIFQNLLSAGLILTPTKQNALSLPAIGPKKDFYSTANKLKLVPQNPEKINVRSPTCPSYVFAGNYVPLLVQLLSFLFQAQNVTDFNSKLELVNGTIKLDNDKCLPLKQKSVFVFVLGGLTYAEIAACSLLEKIIGCRIVLASNCLITGNDLMEQCF